MEIISPEAMSVLSDAGVAIIIVVFGTYGLNRLMSYVAQQERSNDKMTTTLLDLVKNTLLRLETLVERSVMLFEKAVEAVDKLNERFNETTTSITNIESRLSAIEQKLDDLTDRIDHLR